MRIVQLANFYGPRSGGLRTALHHLGAGYAARGHDVVLVVPGAHDADEVLPSGIRRVTIPAPRLPATGGYRAVDPWRVQRLLDRLRPDAIEVSDRLTLRGLGTWARRRGVPSIVISHERLDRLLTQFLLPQAAAERVADLANARMAAAYDTVVCTTAFARAEFERIGARNVAQVPLGVDLATFSPRRHHTGLRRSLGGGADALLVHCGRLSPEKHPERSIDTVAQLRDGGHSVRLVVAGDGPRRPALERRAAGLPVTFVGFVPERARLARLLASADIALAPGPARDVRAVGAGGAGQRHPRRRLGVLGAARDRRRVRGGGDGLARGLRRRRRGAAGGGRAAQAGRGAGAGGAVRVAGVGGGDAGGAGGDLRWVPGPACQESHLHDAGRPEGGFPDTPRVARVRQLPGCITAARRALSSA